MSDILPGEQSLHVLGGDVDLEIHKVADTLVTERRDLGGVRDDGHREAVVGGVHDGEADPVDGRSEEHTSELQSLMRISYAVFCLKKNTQKQDLHPQRHND